MLIRIQDLMTRWKSGRSNRNGRPSVEDTLSMVETLSNRVQTETEKEIAKMETALGITISEEFKEDLYSLLAPHFDTMCRWHREEGEKGVQSTIKMYRATAQEAVAYYAIYRMGKPFQDVSSAYTKATSDKLDNPMSFLCEELFPEVK